MKLTNTALRFVCAAYAQRWVHQTSGAVWRAVIGGFVRRVVFWHLVGMVLGALGLGLGYFVAVRLEGTRGNELLAAPLFMILAGLLGFVVLTPFAIAILGAWTFCAWRLPALESGSMGRRIGLLATVGVLLTLPLALGIVLAVGAGSSGDTRPAIAVVGEALRRDWPVVFAFLPAALGWFVAPRFLIPSLQPRFAPGPESPLKVLAPNQRLL